MRLSTHFEVTYLITAFSKKEQENLTDNEKTVLKKLENQFVMQNTKGGNQNVHTL